VQAASGSGPHRALPIIPQFGPVAVREPGLWPCLPPYRACRSPKVATALGLDHLQDCLQGLLEVKI